MRLGDRASPYGVALIGTGVSMREERARQKRLDREALAAAESAAVLNARLLRIERNITREEGLSGRQWFRHKIYAPGFYTGYGVKTLPNVREAIEQRDWVLAEV